MQNGTHTFSIGNGIKEPDLGKITLGWLRILLALMVIDEHYGYFEGLFDWFVKKQGLSESSFQFCFRR